MTTAEIEYVPVAAPSRKEERKSAAGRKSNAERASRAAEQEKAERAAEIESQRARRLQPDTALTQTILLSIAAVVILTAFTVSYATMVSVAGWIKLPEEVSWLAFAVPGFIELLVILSTLDYIVERSRGKNARGPLWATIALSAVAVLGNAAHTVRSWGEDFGGSNWQSYIGVTLAALAPLVVVYVAKRLSALVFVEVER